MEDATADSPSPSPATGETNADELRFPCVACGSDQLFSPGSEALECPKCFAQTDIPIDRSDVPGRLLDTVDGAAARVRRTFGGGTRTFRCDSCRASCAVPGKTIATRCAFCDDPAVLPVPEDPSTAGAVGPDVVVPFAIDGTGAAERFRAWLADLWFRPDDLRKRAEVGRARGVYVPYFSFDTQAVSAWSGERGEVYHTTESHTTTRHGKRVRRTRRVRHVRWGDWRSGEHVRRYRRRLVCASRGLDGPLLRRIEPFSLGALVRYRHQFLAGFEAEVCTRDPRKAWERIAARLLQREYDSCERLLDGDEHRNLTVETTFKETRYRDVLLPVHIATYAYDRVPWRFMVNGQTGEVYGEAPVSWPKVAGALSIGPVAGLLAFLWSGNPVAGVLVALAATIIIGLGVRSMLGDAASRAPAD